MRWFKGDFSLAFYHPRDVVPGETYRMRSIILLSVARDITCSNMYSQQRGYSRGFYMTQLSRQKLA